MTSEEDMDVVDSMFVNTKSVEWTLIYFIGTIPEPEEVLEKRASMRLPIPRSKSPIKTFLKSPARRNPSLGPVSSPTRGSIVVPRSASVSASVRRRLDFSTNDENSVESATATKKRAGSALPPAGRLTNNNHLQPLGQPLLSDNTNREDDLSAVMEDSAFVGEDSFQMINAGSEDNIEQVEAEEDAEPEVQDAEVDEDKESEIQPAKKGKRKSPVLEEPVEPTKNVRRGRPKKADPAPIQEEEELQDEPKQQPEETQEEQEERPVKRSRRSLDKAPEAAKKKGGRPKKIVEAVEPEYEPEPAEPAAKKPAKAVAKSRQSSVAPSASKSKIKATKAALAPISEDASDSPAVKRGPPLPRNNRGLFILRRETPAQGDGFKQTRSGRNSIKPLAYWRNERVEYSEDENEDGARKFYMPRIKEVVRTDEVDQRKPYRAKSKAKSSKGKKRADADSEDEDLAEPWETVPGKIRGEVRTWDPRDPVGDEAEQVEDDIALSAKNLSSNFKEVRGGEFSYAKTLSTPSGFFGAGILQFGPGGTKRAKNTRRMAMVFFVHYGRVQVHIEENEPFRITKGGIFHVPRGISSHLLFLLWALICRRELLQHRKRLRRAMQALLRSRLRGGSER